MKNKKGFTLVELLIVIALLGALAVGLLAALDPFEQLKKGTDTGTRNTVSEVQGAVIRYYALKGWMPWCTSAADGDCDNPSSESLSGTVMGGAISDIVVSGELKTDFSTLAKSNLGKIFVTGTSQTVKVCFMPSSKAFKCDPNTKFQISGEPQSDPTTCTTNCGANTCYWCVQ